MAALAELLAVDAGDATDGYHHGDRIPIAAPSAGDAPVFECLAAWVACGSAGLEPVAVHGVASHEVKICLTEDGQPSTAALAEPRQSASGPSQLSSSCCAQPKSVHASSR